MKKNFFLDLEVVSGIDSAYTKNSSDIMRITGNNIGNLVFRHGISGMFNLDGFSVGNYRALDQEMSAARAVGQQAGTLVIACANWVSDTDDYEASNLVRANLLEKFDFDIVPLGLGAQASLDATGLKLKKNTERLVRILSERSKTISVRDRFTAEVLSDAGVTNVSVTGCPSNFINCDPDLGRKVVERARSRAVLPNWAAVRSHVSEISGGHLLSADVMKVTVRLMKESPAFYVVQGPTLLGFVLGETDAVNAGLLTNGKSVCGTEADLRRVLLGSVMHFSSVEAWLDFARTCSVALGMRIHGNMVPLQAGVPSVVVAHDSRTEGLASTMNVPTVRPERFIDLVNEGPAGIFDLIAQEMEGYDARRGYLAGNFGAIAKAAGLQLSDRFSKLVGRGTTARLGQ